MVSVASAAALLLVLSSSSSSVLQAFRNVKTILRWNHMKAFGCVLWYVNPMPVLSVPVIYNSLPPWLGFRWVSLLSFRYAKFPPALVLYICSSVCLKDPSPRMPMLLSFLHFALFSDFLFFFFKKKNLFSYLAALNLSCGTLNFCCTIRFL